jgi:hypothetical protein
LYSCHLAVRQHGVGLLIAKIVLNQYPSSAIPLFLELESYGKSKPIRLPATTPQPAVIQQG